MSSAIDTTEEHVRTTPPPAAPSPGVAPQPTRRVRYILAAVVLSAAAVAITLAWPHLFSPPAPSIVKASGRIEGREVTVAAKGIQGRITRLLADEGRRMWYARMRF